jgi:hypothetical protein
MLDLPVPRAIMGDVRKLIKEDWLVWLKKEVGYK